MMVGQPSTEWKIFSFLRSKTAKNRVIIAGLKWDNYSREMLLQLLDIVVEPGDTVLAIHVQEPFDNFDPNTFDIHEDLCKSKQAQTISSQYLLKRVAPNLLLLIIDNTGRIVLQRQGNSQQGSTYAAIRASLSSSPQKSCFHQQRTACQLQNSSTVPSSSTASSIQQMDGTRRYSVNKIVQVPDFLAKKLFQGLVLLDTEELIRNFTFQELNSATNNFSHEMMIGEGGHSKVYRANLNNGQPATVKVLKTKHVSVEDPFQEVGILSSIKHENIAKIIGYCDSKEMHEIVYNLLRGSLKQNLKQLKWGERMGVATGVAKALEDLHHSLNPPVIHRDVKSSNILLSDNCQPQLSDFGAAMVQHQSKQTSASIMPFKVVGTFGYLAPEYIMYGKVDEKVDVYSYGVVLQQRRDEDYNKEDYNKE